jgi:maltooligosyltrehalose trehalohydrolase
MTLSTTSGRKRRLAAGVEWQAPGPAHARVWAPACAQIEIVREGGEDATALQPADDGWHEGEVPWLEPGGRYWLRLDGERLRPDPVSRFQPDGPHGPSMLVDPAAFAWHDQDWRGVPAAGQVLYEMHIGTFTPEGTWESAARELPRLARMGITCLEVMPVAEFAGRYGWGYDGVCLYAPTRLYGTPDDFRRFVDAAHASGLGVILDVVYNHLGPDGNYLHEFSEDYFTDHYTNDWGRALNFEGPAAAREFFAANGAYWVDEYHLDGLRLDATQDVKDASPRHVIEELVSRARTAAAPRACYVVAENEPQHTDLVRPPETGGCGVDALWNDDYHHSAVAALTGRREAYYIDYTGAPQEFVSSAKYGYLYQGQWYRWQDQRRGTPALDLPATAFVTFLENHDQVANTAFGTRLRLKAHPGRYRAITALTLLGPGTPMLFQGQEYGSTRPFLYFADHRAELAESIREGRREFLKQFPSTIDPEVQRALPVPSDEETFRRCVLDPAERERYPEIVALHRDLLRIRAADRAIAAAATTRVDGAVLAPMAFLLRYDAGGDGSRLLIVNMGPDLDPSMLAEPLMAPPAGSIWTLQWSSEAVRYGGNGTGPINPNTEWHIPGEAAVLLRSEVLARTARAEAHG